jgi:hypothetical protein
MATTMSALSQAFLLFALASFYMQSAAAQEATQGDCRTRLLAAMKTHGDLPDSLHAIERRLRVAMYSSDTAVRGKSFDAVVTVAAAGQMMKGSGFVVVSDDRHTIRRDDSSHTIHVLDHLRHRKAYAAQRRVSTLLPDSLVENAVVAGCIASPDGGVIITVVVEPRLRRFFNADTVRFTLTRTNAIAALAISHPDVSPLSRTEITVVSSRTIPVPAIFLQPVLSTYFDDAGRLLPAYRSWRLLGRDHQSSLSR